MNFDSQNNLIVGPIDIPCSGLTSWGATWGVGEWPSLWWNLIFKPHRMPHLTHAHFWLIMQAIAVQPLFLVGCNTRKIMQQTYVTLLLLSLILSCCPMMGSGFISCCCVTHESFMLPQVLHVNLTKYIRHILMMPDMSQICYMAGMASIGCGSSCMMWMNVSRGRIWMGTRLELDAGSNLHFRVLLWM